MKWKVISSIVIISVSAAILFLKYNSSKMKSIETFLKNEVESNHTPSVQYFFFDTEAILYQGRYGMKNVRSGIPVDSTTTYNLFSVTKTFTALSILQLAQAGKLKLSDPASLYIKDFPYKEVVTIEQLLQHSAGMPNPVPLRWIHLATEHNAFNGNLFFSEIFKKHHELESVPGTKFKYSNLGYVLLGQVIENVSGQRYEDYISENIIKRIGIPEASLGFYIDTAVHATGYHKWLSVSNALFGFLIDKQKFMGDREGKWKPFHNFYPNGAAYGGMVGSAMGLITYAQDLLQNHSMLIGNEYRQFLFTENSIGNQPTGMSCSWFTGKLKGHKYLAHAGGGGGYYVELRLYPELGTGSLIMYNRSGMRDERILDQTDAFFLSD